MHGQDLPEADESYSLPSPYPYCRTKALAEQAVRDANDVPGGFVTLVLRPRFIWGPGDQTLLKAEIGNIATAGISPSGINNAYVSILTIITPNSYLIGSPICFDYRLVTTSDRARVSHTRIARHLLGEFTI